LAANLSLRGYGIAPAAAFELQDQLREVIAVLSDAEIQSAFGARDMWQVIDQVAERYLDGAKSSERYCTLAQSGASVIDWLSYVTQVQLQASLARVEGTIKSPSDDVSTTNSRIAAEGQSKDLNHNQLLVLLSLLGRPASTGGPKIGTGAVQPLTDASGNTIGPASMPATNNIDSLLPLLLMSCPRSAGGLSLGGDSKSGDVDNSPLLLALVLAFSRDK
jgi:hypothetical protein